MSSVSSPPTITTGRLIRTQRRSRGAERMTLPSWAAAVSLSSETWLIGSNIVMMLPSTSIACGMYMSPPIDAPMPSASTVLPFPGGP